MATEPTLDDAVQLRADLAATQAELTKTRDLYYQILATENERERRSRAGERRAVQEHIDSLAEHYVRHAASGALVPLTGLVYRVQQLGDRAGAKQVAELKTAASEADAALRLYGRDTPPAVKEIAAERAEVTRLRDHVLAAGRELHDQHAAGGGDSGLGPGQGGCKCRGCMLIIGMDDVPEEPTPTMLSGAPR